jgi:hypothetical protein
MSNHELILLSPYRLPTHHSLYLADEDVAAFLNGLAALWHPAALRGAVGPPRIASPYDHEQPQPNCVYATPEHPPLLLPDDWGHRVKEAGSITFKAFAGRDATLDNLKDALRSRTAEGEAADPLIDRDAERTAPFFGLGFGHDMMSALFEAHSHENMLDAPAFWKDVQDAVAALSGDDADAPRRCLTSAAERLVSAREVLYPASLHLVDLGLLDPTHPDGAWPASFDKGLALNLIACASLLERIGRDQPERLAKLRDRVAADLVEVCGGPYLEREDALLPLESQLWNLLKGQAVTKQLLDREVSVFARRRFAFDPHTPLLLQSVGISRALLLAFDESIIPAHRTTVVNWPSPDGKQVQCFTRTPLAADSPQTFFHLAHHLHHTIMQDHAATLALLHRDKTAGPWYDDWLELSRLAPALGKWVTLSAYLREVLAGDYTSAASADDFHGDYLVERANPPEGRPIGPERTEPVSGFARQVRARRSLDTAWTLAAMTRSLGGHVEPPDGESFDARLTHLEDRVESEPIPPIEELIKAQDEAAATLARRLTARGQPDNPGYLVLNPCSFNRRVALELGGLTGPIPQGGPVKASQFNDGVGRIVVEVPALGFAWFPRQGPPGPPPSPGRLRLADDRCVRNEYFEAEIDPATGGLRAIRDPRTRVNRLGQQMVFNPGSTAHVQQIRTTSTGPALGEIISEGVLIDAKDEVLGSFRQRFRAWAGRPLLEIRIDLKLTQPAKGYPWHSYYGARFAWRDEQASLTRGVLGASYTTSHTRPETPDYLELRTGAQNTAIFPGGLPFHQRHGSRMLDVILSVEGEETSSFELAIGVDRGNPMQTASGVATPVPVVETSMGPPHVGAAGWLFHLDAPNLLLTSLRPAPAGADGVTARLLEIGGVGGQAQWRCVRDPKQARLLDAHGEATLDLPIQGDAVQMDVGRNDLIQMRVDFS